MFPQSTFGNLIKPGPRTGDRPSLWIAAAVLAIGSAPVSTTASEALRLEGSLRLSGSVYRIHQIGAKPAMTVAETAGQQLARIKEHLCPSIADLAQAFGVSRQSIYAWLRDDPVAEGNAARIHDLAAATDVIVRAGFAQERSLLRRRFQNGKTLLQVVAAGGSATEAAGTLVDVLQREQAESALLSSRLAGRPNRAPSADFDFPAS